MVNKKQKEGQTNEIILNLKNDVIFQAFFSRKGNEKYLIDFLNALLKMDIKSIKIREEVNLEKLSKEEKGGRLDLQAKLGDGTIVSIEMQMRDEGNFKQRTTMYAGKVESRETKKGIKYEDISQIIMINILGFNMLDVEDYISETAIVLDKHRDYEVLTGIKWYFIELPKFRKAKPDMNEKINQWLAFIDDDNKEMIDMAENKNKTLKDQKSLSVNSQTYQIHDSLNDFIKGKVPNLFTIIVSDYSYLVVPDMDDFQESIKGTATTQATYVGVNVKDPSHDAKKNSDLLDKITDKETQQLAGQTTGLPKSYFTANSRYDAEGMVNGFVGGTFFIGIFLSIIFMLGTVLVIYYKQISEGYEDRERFVILQKIGLDDLQVKQTIGKQVLTVFFLPLIFAFIHLAFAYHMISLIVRIIGVLNPDLMLVVTIIVCGVFFLVYVLVFALTSRSYRRIVSM